jgi:hypothetical protein
VRAGLGAGTGLSVRARLVVEAGLGVRAGNSKRGDIRV